MLKPVNNQYVKTSEIYKLRVHFLGGESENHMDSSLSMKTEDLGNDHLSWLRMFREIGDNENIPPKLQIDGYPFFPLKLLKLKIRNRAHNYREAHFF